MHCMPSPSTPCLFRCLYTTSAPTTNWPLRSATVPLTPSAPSSTLTETASRVSRAWPELDTLELRCVLPLTRLSLSDRAELDAAAAWTAAPSLATVLGLLDLGRDAALLAAVVSASEADRSAVSRPRFLITSLGSSCRIAFSSSLSLRTWRYQPSSWFISATVGSTPS